jgi:hypothetical protein
MELVADSGEKPAVAPKMGGEMMNTAELRGKLSLAWKPSP